MRNGLNKKNKILRKIFKRLKSTTDNPQYTISMEKELELTDEMVERNDTIYNSIYECICILAENNIEWDMKMIGEITESVISILSTYGIKVRYPSVVTEENGTQYYSD